MWSFYSINSRHLTWRYICLDRLAESVNVHSSLMQSFVWCYFCCSTLTTVYFAILSWLLPTWVQRGTVNKYWMILFYTACTLFRHQTCTPSRSCAIKVTHYQSDGTRVLCLKSSLVNIFYQQTLFTTQCWNTVNATIISDTLFVPGCF